MSNASERYVENCEWQPVAMLVTAFGLVAGYVAISQLVWGGEVGESVLEAWVSILPAHVCYLIGYRARDAERARQRGWRYAVPWYRWSQWWYGAHAAGVFLLIALCQLSESWLGMAALAPLFGIFSYRSCSLYTRSGQHAQRVAVPVERRVRLWNEPGSEACHATA